MVMTNGKVSKNSGGGSRTAGIGIHTFSHPNEWSHWGIMELLTYNRHLSLEEAGKVVDYLQQRLDGGNNV